MNKKALSFVYPMPLEFATSLILNGIQEALSPEFETRSFFPRFHITSKKQVFLWLYNVLSLTLSASRNAEAVITIAESSVSVKALKQLFRVPVVAGWYDAFSDIAANIPSWKKPLVRFIYENVKNADAVLCVSEKLAEMALRIRGGPKGVYYPAPTPVHPDFFSPEKYPPDTVRSRLQIPPEACVVGFAGRIGVGRFTADKENFTEKHLAQQADNILKRSSQPVSFLIVGAGEGLPRFKAFVESKNLPGFVFTGHVPHHKVPEYISAMDICVNTMDDCFAAYHRNAYKIKGYMAMGKPVVATSIGENVKDLEGNCGLLCRQDNADLPDKILELIHNPSLRQTLGENARKRALERHSFQAVNIRMKKVLSDIL